MAWKTNLRSMLALGLTLPVWAQVPLRNPPVLESPTNAEVCGDCHRGALEAWKASGHAHAMDSRLFQDTLHYTELDLGPAAREKCWSCHAPLAVATGDRGLRSKMAWEGVSCDFCHSVREVSMSGPNPQARVEYTRIRTGPWKGETPNRHGVLASELHKSSLLCATCHEHRNANGLPVMSTFSEWKASRYAKEGHECETCHMPSVGRVDLVQRIVATPTDVERHSHCEGCHDVKAQRTPPVSGTEGDPRERGKVNVHGIEGHSTGLLARAIGAQLTAMREGDKVKVVVDVTNRGAGHYVPTGSPLRQLVLEVRADTDNGQHQVQERVYCQTVVDGEGKPVEREHMVFERGSKIAADTRLAPEEKRSETFLFDIRPGVETRIGLEFRYLYSPLQKIESRKSATFLTMNSVVR